MMFLLHNIFDAANKPNTKRNISIKFLTKLGLFCLYAPRQPCPVASKKNIF